VERLVDTIERSSAEGLPLPEITRTVLQSIMRHQGGVLQDDATLLMLQWTTAGQAHLSSPLLHS